METRNQVERTIRGVARIVGPWLKTVFNTTSTGREHLEQDSGFILIANHLTVVDPLIVGYLAYEHGHLPRYMAKSSMFQWPVLGKIMRASKQVPVARGTSDAAKSIAVAQEILQEGECLIIFPEGTLTKDPELWPMRAYTGAARLALATGAPVVPVAHWGDQVLFGRKGTRRLRLRTQLDVLVGAPVPLDDLRGKPLTRETLDQATERMMDAITGQLAQLRGQQAPAVRFDPRAKGQR